MHPVVRHLDLFSGIGGFALACRMVGGIETVAFCEREPYCQRVLAKHWPTVPICNDIHDLKGTEYGTVELITGGFPCQPFSHAGKRKGKDDDRHLWPEYLRIIATARPRWILGENVAGIVSMELDQVLSDLDGQGYASQCFVVPACAVDAGHRRDRVWIVAHADSGGCVHGKSKVEPAEAGIDAQRQSFAGGADVADSNGSGMERREDSRSVESCWAGCDQQPCGRREVGAVAESKTRRLSERATEKPVQHDACGGSVSARGDFWFRWDAEPCVGRVAHGIPNRVDRVKSLGNAIVPQVAAEIIRAMMLADRMANAGAVPRRGSDVGTIPLLGGNGGDL